MKVGISLTSAIATPDPREGARYMIERAAASARAGLDSLTVGDHHVVGAPYYQNVPIMGRLLAEWDPARQAGCLFLLPLWNPVLVAEQVGTLASLSDARFILQCAVGDGAQQFNGMGAPMRRRASDFEEGLGIVTALLAGQTISSSRHGFGPAKIAPIPLEPVEVWIGGTARPAIERASRMGDAWYASPHLTRQDAASRIETYRACLSANGHPTGRIPIRRDVYVGESAAEAAEVKARTVAGGYRGFDASALVAGDPESVASQFRELGSMGYTDVIVRHMIQDQEKVLGSIRRLASVVSMVAGA